MITFQVSSKPSQMDNGQSINDIEQAIADCLPKDIQAIKLTFAIHDGAAKSSMKILRDMFKNGLPPDDMKMDIV